jgi:hypothetical protein
MNCVDHKEWPDTDAMETKFLRLRTPVEFGARFGDWQVCWLGEWAICHLYYLVMLVKVPCIVPAADRRIDLAFGANRAMNGVAMNPSQLTQTTTSRFSHRPKKREPQRLATPNISALPPGTGQA